MNIVLKKIGGGKFSITNDYDLIKYNKIKGECICKIKKIRSPITHRRFFAMLNIAFNNQDLYNTFESFRKTVEILSGYYDPIMTIHGELIGKSPKSIAYESLDENEFREVAKNIQQVILNQFIHIDNESLENEINNFSF